MRMKAAFLILFLLYSFLIKAQISVLLQENFTNYLGTSATIPAGWNFSYNGNYTSTTYSGTSGPNSYKFGTNNATIITPAFVNADSVSFWIKGAAVDTLSSLTVYETSDSISWTIISTLNPLPTSGTAYTLPVQPTSTHLKFSYTKSAGNLAFDDFRVEDYIVYPSSGDIKIYFNNPVDISVSTGVNAVYLNQSLDDTLAAYINRANYSLDIAVYNYVQSGSIAAIDTAINNAYNRGVKIRWIYNSSSGNTGLSLLNTGINKLASPTVSSYGLMHNKFMVVDMSSPNPYDAIVWTGSCNWDASQFNNDVNNTVIIQDKNLGYAYTAEFNEMWGDTGLVPNTTNSKFGPFKTDNVAHFFSIGGKTIELYFSPSDGTNTRILSSVSGADNDLYLGMSTFTLNENADSIKSRIQNAGVYGAAIIDATSQSYAPYTTLQPVMGNNLKIYSNGVYHNKYLIADACDAASDPLVLTGSHNWTASADQKNDENSLIIHDDTIANIFYQSFYKDFLSTGDTLVPCSSISVEEIFSENDLKIFPNPSEGKIRIQSRWLSGSEFRIQNVEVYNVLGEKIYFLPPSGGSAGGGLAIDLSGIPNGIYFLKTAIGGKHFTSKIIIQH